MKECRICNQTFYGYMDDEICYSCELSLCPDEPEDFSGMDDDEIDCALIGHEEHIEECTDGSKTAFCIRCFKSWKVIPE